MLKNFHEFSQGLYTVPNFNVKPSVKREIQRLRTLSMENPNNTEIQSYVVEKLRKIGTFK